jgi:hypothetical protein
MTSAIHNEGFLHRFLKFAENYPNAIAINDIDNDRQLSYKQLNDLAKKRKMICYPLASKKIVKLH